MKHAEVNAFMDMPGIERMDSGPVFAVSMRLQLRDEGQRMETVARVFPIRSKQALVELGQKIDKWSVDDKREFFRLFGPSVERWYFQEIDGKPHVIAITRVDSARAGFEHLAAFTDRFTSWFRGEVLALTGVDLAANSRDPESEFIYEFRI